MGEFSQTIKIRADTQHAETELNKLRSKYAQFFADITKQTARLNSISNKMTANLMQTMNAFGKMRGMDLGNVLSTRSVEGFNENMQDIVKSGKMFRETFGKIGGFEFLEQIPTSPALGKMQKDYDKLLPKVQQLNTAMSGVSISQAEIAGQKPTTGLLKAFGDKIDIDLADSINAATTFENRIKSTLHMTPKLKKDIEAVGKAFQKFATFRKGRAHRGGMPVDFPTDLDQLLEGKQFGKTFIPANKEAQKLAKTLEGQGVNVQGVLDHFKALKTELIQSGQVVDKVFGPSLVDDKIVASFKKETGAKFGQDKQLLAEQMQMAKKLNVELVQGQTDGLLGFKKYRKELGEGKIVLNKVNAELSTFGKANANRKNIEQNMILPLEKAEEAAILAKRAMGFQRKPEGELKNRQAVTSSEQQSLSSQQAKLASLEAQRDVMVQMNSQAQANLAAARENQVALDAQPHSLREFLQQSKRKLEDAKFEKKLISSSIDKHKELIPLLRKQLSIMGKLNQLGMDADPKERTKLQDANVKARARILSAIKEIPAGTREGLPGDLIPSVERVRQEIASLQGQLTLFGKAKKAFRDGLMRFMPASAEGRAKAIAKAFDPSEINFEKAFAQRVGEAKLPINPKELGSLAIEMKRLGKTIPNEQIDKMAQDFVSVDKMGGMLSPKMVRQTHRSMEDMAHGMEGNLGMAGEGLLKQFDDLTKGRDKFLKERVSGRTQIGMNYLSIMFFGQMLQKSFTRLMTTGTQSFMKIVDETNEAKQGMSALGAAAEFVRFSIGQALAEALAPYIPKIIEIAELTSDWIQKNQGLVATIIGAGALVGGVMALWGTTKLLIVSITNLIELKAGLWKFFTWAGEGFDKLTSGMTGLEKTVSGLSLVGAATFTVLAVKDFASGDIMQGVGKSLMAAGFAINAVAPGNIVGVSLIALGAIVSIAMWLGETMGLSKGETEKAVRDGIVAGGITITGLLMGKAAGAAAVAGISTGGMAFIALAVAAIVIGVSMWFRKGKEERKLKDTIESHEKQLRDMGYKYHRRDGDQDIWTLGGEEGIKLAINVKTGNLEVTEEANVAEQERQLKAKMQAQKERTEKLMEEVYADVAPTEDTATAPTGFDFTPKDIKDMELSTAVTSIKALTDEDMTMLDDFKTNLIPIKEILIETLENATNTFSALIEGLNQTKENATSSFIPTMDTMTDRFNNKEKGLIMAIDNASGSMSVLSDNVESLVKRFDESASSFVNEINRIKDFTRATIEAAKAQERLNKAKKAKSKRTDDFDDSRDSDPEAPEYDDP